MTEIIDEYMSLTVDDRWPLPLGSVGMPGSRQRRMDRLVLSPKERSEARSVSGYGGCVFDDQSIPQA
jgi:hypothetical protein